MGPGLGPSLFEVLQKSTDISVSQIKLVKPIFACSLISWKESDQRDIIAQGLFLCYGVVSCFKIE